MSDDPFIRAIPAMRDLTRALVPRLLEGDDPRLEILRAQWRAATIHIVGPSNFGFYADITVPPDIARLAVPNRSDGDATIPVEGSPVAAGCVLTLIDGALADLEVYTAVDWATPPVFGTPTDIAPLRLRDKARD